MDGRVYRKKKIKEVPTLGPGKNVDRLKCDHFYVTPHVSKVMGHPVFPNVRKYF